MKIAFLGIGIMGLPMARNLRAAGHAVTVWNRSPEKARPLVEDGARLAASPAEAARGAEVLFTMLSDGAAVADLLFDQGAAAALPAGGLVIDCSSIAPREARAHAIRLAEIGLAALDAPVSGGPSGAEAASLAIMVGGEAAAVERGLALLRHLGRPTPVGPPGAGQLAKLANQIIVGLAIGAVSEGLLLASAGGADPAAVRQAMTGGLADSLVLQIHGERMLERRFLPGAAAAVHLKDLRNILDEAKDLGLTLPLAEAMEGLYAKLVETRGPGVDHSGILLEIERRNAKPPYSGARLGGGEDRLP
ncbi:MAG: NAD(P)-dependent oxidoreductase [Rhodospirillales bacterium]